MKTNKLMNEIRATIKPETKKQNQAGGKAPNKKQTHKQKHHKGGGGAFRGVGQDLKKHKGRRGWGVGGG